MKFIQKPGNVDNNKQESAEIKNDSKAKQPESKDEFSVIYEEIVNQLNSMEQQLAQNREKFLNNVKIKERENIILNGKLGLLEKNIRDYRLIKEQELKNFESESKSELSLFEKRIEEEFNDWNNKILLKEQEMEQYRNSVLVKTTGAQVNYQQKEREMKVEIGELQKQKNSLGNNLQHEKQIYELRVKNKDDEILKLKEEIAQKESEHTMEIEKYNISMDGMKHNWQQKMASIEEQFKNKCDELKETYSRKENELAMIKADFENKYKELNSEQTGKSRQLISLRDSVTVKIHDLEKRISQEVSLWEELLKQREDEYNKLKIDIVMKEAQNKKDVERMRELFLLEQQEIQQKIKLIENKYFQEKKNYEQMFELKDSEIENLKLESQLKMKELHEQWIIKQRDIFSEKKQLEEQLEVYRNKILAETDSWKKQVAEKNNEIESFKKEHENKQESIKLHYEETIVELKERKNTLLQQLKEIESKYRTEKIELEKMFKAKSNEYDIFKNEAETKLTDRKHEILLLEDGLKKEQLPLIEQINKIKQQISVKHDNFTKLMNEKEKESETYGIELETNKKQLARKYDNKISGYTAENNALIAKISGINEEIAGFNAEFDKLIKQKESEINSFKLELNNISDSFAKEKENKARENNEIIKKLKTDITNSNNEYSGIESEINRVIEQKDYDKSKYEKQLEELEQEWAVKNNGMEQLLSAEKNKLESELKNIDENYNMRKAGINEKIKSKDTEIDSVRREIQLLQVQLNSEINILVDRFNKEKIPLVEQIENTKIKISEKQKYYSNYLQKFETVIKNLILDYDNRKQHLISQYDSRVKQHNDEKTGLTDKISQVKRNLANLDNEFDVSNRQKTDLFEGLKSELSNYSINSKKELETKKKEFSVKLETLARELSGLNNKFMEIESEGLNRLNIKETEKNSRESELKKAEQDLTYKNSAVENEIITEKARLETELKQINEVYDSKKSGYDDKIKFKNIEIDAMRREIQAEQAKFNKEIAELEQKTSQEENKLEKQKNQVTESIKKIQFDINQKTGELDKQIIVQKNLCERRMIELASLAKSNGEQLEEEKTRYMSQISAKQRAIKMLEEQASQILLEKENELAQIKLIQDKSVAEYLKQKSTRESEWETGRSNLKNNIINLENELEKMKIGFPGQLQAKNSELNDMKLKIENLDLQNENERNAIIEKISVFTREADKKTARLDEKLISIEKELAARINEKNDQLLKMRNAYEIQNKQLSEEYEFIIGNIETEQKKLLETKENLVESITKSQISFQEETREKDKEILSLRQKLAENENKWKEDIGQIISGFDIEKKELATRIEMLKNRIKNEQEQNNRKLEEKDRQIDEFKVYEQNKQNLTVTEFNNKKAELAELNNKLRSKLEELNIEFNDLKTGWEKGREEKEYIFNDLKNKLLLMETRTQSEKSKKDMEEQEVIGQLSQQINLIQTQLEKQESDYNIMMSQKQQEIEKLQKEFKNNGEITASQWQETEKELLQQKETLSAQIELIDRKTREHQSIYEKSKRDLQQSIDKLKLEHAIRSTELETGRNKQDYELKKINRDLESKIINLRNKFDEQKETINIKLQARDIEINTLKMRLSAREDRIRNEIMRRKKEYSILLQELAGEYEKVSSQSISKLPRMNEELNGLQQDYDLIKAQLENLETEWETEQSDMTKLKEEEIKKINDEISQIESGAGEAVKNLENQFKTKLKQIELLAEFVTLKDRQVNKEMSRYQQTLNKIKELGRK